MGIRMLVVELALIACITKSQIIVNDIRVSAIGPEPRDQASIAYSEHTSEIFLFGGFVSFHLNDLWKFNLKTEKWEAIYPNSVSPEPRSKSIAFIRSNNKEFCIFGGNSNSGIRDDMWCYLINLNYWKKVNFLNEPFSLYKSFHCFFEHNSEDILALVGFDCFSYELQLNIFNFKSRQWKFIKLGLHFKQTLSFYDFKHTEALINKYKEDLIITIVTMYFKLKFVIVYNLNTESLSHQDLISKKPLGFNVGFITSILKNESIYLFCEGQKVLILSLTPKLEMNGIYFKNKLNQYEAGVASISDGYILFGGWIEKIEFDKLMIPLTVYRISNSIMKFWLDDFNVLMNKELVDSYDFPSLRVSYKMSIIRGQFYLFGGYANGIILGDLWKYNPESYIWQLLTSSGKSPSPRFAYALSAEGDAMLIFGGQDKKGLNNDIFLYNSYTNEWAQFEPNGSLMPSKRKNACAVLKMPLAFIIGGIDAYSICSDFWKFDFGGNFYQKISNIPKILNIQCISDEDFVYIKGTFSINNTSTELILSYDLKTEAIRTLHTNLTSQGIFLKVSDYFVNIGGMAQGKLSNKVYLFNSNEMTEDFIDDYPHAVSALYYNNYIYYIGGSFFYNEYTVFPDLPRPKFAKINFSDICKAEKCRTFCSPGFYFSENTCKICPFGFYSEEFNSTSCIPCGKGYFNDREGASSMRQCYICPEGTFNNFLGSKFCKICPQSGYCPAGAKEALFMSKESIDEISIQPKLFTGNDPSAALNYTNYIFSGIIFIVSLFIIKFDRIKVFVSKLDLFDVRHTYKDGEKARKQKNTVGGFFSLQFYAISSMIILGMTVNFLTNNLVESQSLIPLAILEEMAGKFYADFTVEISLNGYGDICGERICSSNIVVNKESIEIGRDEITCRSRSGNSCFLAYSCFSCVIQKDSYIEVYFKQKLSYATGITVNLTLDSSIPEAHSSIFKPILPETGYIFMGPKASEFLFTVIPSYFESTSHKYQSRITGYHCTSASLSSLGSQTLIENLPISAQVHLIVRIERQDVGFYTIRQASQNSVLLLSSMFGTISGILGFIGYFMSQFEKGYKKMSERSEKANKVQQIFNKKIEIRQCYVSEVQSENNEQNDDEALK